jgi:hypothetical protein
MHMTINLDKNRMQILLRDTCVARQEKSIEQFMTPPSDEHIRLEGNIRESQRRTSRLRVGILLDHRVMRARTIL